MLILMLKKKKEERVLLHGDISTVFLCLFARVYVLGFRLFTFTFCHTISQKKCQVKTSRHFGDSMFVCWSIVGDCFLTE